MGGSQYNPTPSHPALDTMLRLDHVNEPRLLTVDNSSVGDLGTAINSALVGRNDVSS